MVDMKIIEGIFIFGMIFAVTSGNWKIYLVSLIFGFVAIAYKVSPEVASFLEGYIDPNNYNFGPWSAIVIFMIYLLSVYAFLFFNRVKKEDSYTG